MLIAAWTLLILGLLPFVTSLNPACSIDSCGGYAWIAFLASVPFILISFLLFWRLRKKAPSKAVTVGFWISGIPTALMIGYLLILTFFIFHQ